MRTILRRGLIPFAAVARAGWMAGLLSLLMVSCGKEEVPPVVETIRVTLLDVRNEGRVDVYQDLARQFTESHPGAVVECVTRTVNPEEPNRDPAGWLADTDVVIFPSYLNSVFRDQPNTFYPITREEADIPSVIQLAYAESAPPSYWAMPLVIDPYVLVIKKREAGESSPPSDWPAILFNATLYKQIKRLAGPPLFVFLSRDPMSLADSVAAHQLAFGYGRDFLHGMPFEPDVTPEINRENLNRALRNLKLFIQEDPAAAVAELPKAEDLEDFVRNEPFVTIAKLSRFRALPEETRNALFAIPLPTPYKHSVACHVTAAGVPIGAEKPALGEQWIAFLRESVDPLAERMGVLPARTGGGGVAGEVYPPDTIYILRENTKTLTAQNLIDALNGGFDKEELEKMWTAAFYFPSH